MKIIKYIFLLVAFTIFSAQGFAQDTTEASKTSDTSGAQEGTRTPTSLRTPAPKADASTNFAT